MEEKILRAFLTDKLHSCIAGSKVELLGFLDPAEQEVARSLLEGEEGVSYGFSGGYRGAERKRLAIMSAVYIPEAVDYHIGALEISCEGGGRALGHRELLGTILGLGIDRSNVGDILTLKGRSQVVLTDNMLGFVAANLVKVGRTPVRVQVIDLDALETPVTSTKEVKGTVASLRLDAVGALGFGTSRAKMAQDIKEQRVRLNWRPVDGPSAPVREGDIISVRGRGRVVLERVAGETRKGRISVVLKRLI